MVIKSVTREWSNQFTSLLQTVERKVITEWVSRMQTECLDIAAPPTLRSDTQCHRIPAQKSKELFQFTMP